MKDNFVVRFNKILEEKNISQTELSKLTGITQSSISDWKNGKYTPKQDKINILAKALNVSPAWLIGYDVSNDEIHNIKNILPLKKSSKRIPLIGTIAAGEPILAEQNIEEYIELDKIVQADFCLRIKGDSMINANIYEDDIVFIHKQSDVDDGEIAAVLIEDEATLKRVYKMPGKVVLRAENPRFKPIILNGDKSVEILGKATYKISQIR
ncbi:transcriptional repressor LexA [Peptoniphilus sp.]|jgi:repressor LexA|uniref:transcriptional repressor LexA n=1 Tax=Peptoniphilus sp. TaxID=1971214 RepID=UPI003D90E9FC